MADPKSGSETIGAAGEKGKMTLFKDDRQEDTGAIVVAALIIAGIIIMSPKAPPAPAAPAATTAPATAPAAPAPAPAPAK